MERVEGPDRQADPVAGLSSDARTPSRAVAQSGTLRLAGRLLMMKARVKGFRRLSRWLKGRDGLILSADQAEPLLVLRLGDFLRHCRFRDPEASAAYLNAEGSVGPGTQSAQDRRRSKRA